MSNTDGNPLEREEEFLGMASTEVPQAEAGEYCNAKKTERTEDGTCIFAGYCEAEAGKGTEHFGDGRCKHHGGAIRDGGPGAPEGNQNAQTHALNADPNHYYESLEKDDRTFVDNTSEAILSRLQAGSGEIDDLDRKLAHRVAVKFHIVGKASDYVENESGLIDVAGDGNQDREATLLDEIRKYDHSIIDDLETLGILEDPESQEADALSQWREFVEGDSDSF